MTAADFLPRIASGDLAAALVLADYLDEHNDPRAAEVRQLASVSPRELAARVYDARRAGISLPEGGRERGLWYPTFREDGDDIQGRVRAPSARHPWRYLRACLTRKHCTVLVLRFLAGHGVPVDVRDVVGQLVETILDLMAPPRVEGADQY